MYLRVICTNTLWTTRPIIKSCGQKGGEQVTLTSPSGTTSTLLPLRPGDIYPNSYDSWQFLSVHFWGENPLGVWTIRVRFTDVVGTIRVSVPTVTIYGTSVIPEAVSRIPSTCSPECDSTRGCAALGAEFCDGCANVRIASSLECASICPDGLSERNGYCYNASLPEATCEAVRPTRSPSSALGREPLSIFTIFIVALVTTRY